MSDVYLALRKRPKDGLLHKLSAWLISFRLVSEYHHGGIVCDGVLYDVTAKHNMSASKFDNEGWDLIRVYTTKEKVLSLYKKHKDVKYDYFSLLAFLGLKASDSKRLYCFEWCYLVITGDKPKGRVTVETLLRILTNENNR